MKPVTDLPPEVKAATHEQQQIIDDKPFPLIMTPSEPIDLTLNPAYLECTDKRSPPYWINWVEKHADELNQLLIKYGALLFRGFPVQTATDFDSFTKGFGWENFPYTGGAAARRCIVGNVVTSNEAPTTSTISYHHEMGHVPKYPATIFFWCDVEPAEGGETPFVMSHVAYNRIKAAEPEMVERLEKEGVSYIRVCPDGDNTKSAVGRGWQATFFTNDKKEAERRATELGITYEWLPDGSMKTIGKTVPAVRIDPRNKRKTWHNSIAATHTGYNDERNKKGEVCTYGNSKDYLPLKSLDTMLNILDDLAVVIPWKRCDVLLLDNRQTLHARKPFKLPRNILAALYKESDFVFENTVPTPDI